MQPQYGQSSRENATKKNLPHPHPHAPSRACTGSCQAQCPHNDVLKILKGSFISSLLSRHFTKPVAKPHYHRDEFFQYRNKN